LTVKAYLIFEKRFSVFFGFKLSILARMFVRICHRRALRIPKFWYPIAKIWPVQPDFGQFGQNLAGHRRIPFYTVDIFLYKPNVEKYFQKIYFF
jgi:hypothetical protein